MDNEPSPFRVATGPRGFPVPPVMEPIKGPLLVNVIIIEGDLYTIFIS